MGERCFECGMKGLGTSSMGHEYQKEIDYLMKLIDDHAPVIDAL